MPEKFKNKYRVASHRKPGWDYSANGMYFITLVTQNRICNLGEIVKLPVCENTHERAYIHLSDFGKIVDVEWHKSFEIRDELFLDVYIIMPNHLHAIVVINKNDKMAVVKNDDTVLDDTVETHGSASLRSRSRSRSQSRSQSRSRSQSFYRLPKSISSFMAGFKSAVNSKIDDYIDQHNLNIPKFNRNNHFFQPNYHDHIIRDEQSYQRISDYIKNNPEKWANYKFYTD